MRENQNILSRIELPVLFLYLALTLIGWLSIYAAVFNEDHTSIFDITQRYGKQLLWIGLALVLGLIVLLTDSRFFNGFAFFIYFATLLMLVAVLVFGSTVSGSKSWFQIGGFGLQPAEFAKFSTGLALAAFLNRLETDMHQTRTKIISIIIIALPAILTLMQYDTGSALVFSAFVLVLYREGLSAISLVLGLIAIVLFIVTLYFTPLYVIMGIALLLAGALFFIKRNLPNILRLIALFALASMFIVSVGYVFNNILEPHQRTRINVLLGLDEDLRGAGYNVHQSKIGIG